MKLFKKIMKRLFQIVLIYFILLLAYTLILETSYNIKYDNSTATENSEIIGTISIYASPIDKITKSRYVGHAWVYIENTSDEPFTINGIVVEPNKGITMGTTQHPTIETSGIWFNIESFNSGYLENVSLTANFYQEDLESLETYLSKHNRWNVFYNCATFASGVWNNSYEGRQTPVFAITPKGLRRDISKIDGYAEDKPFIFSDREYMVPYAKED